MTLGIFLKGFSIKGYPFSTKWLPRSHNEVVFKANVLNFEAKNTSLKDKNGKRKFKRIFSFCFVGSGKLFVTK